jgi:DNA polymerase III sliding clamp (beta) subunit (PCNA family)
MLDVSCSTKYGKVNDNLKIEKTGEDIVIGVNGRYFIDTLNACHDDFVNLEMSAPLLPIHITPSNKKPGSSLTYLVSPYRLKD